MRTLLVMNVKRLATATLLAIAIAGCSSETKPVPPEAAPIAAPDATPGPEVIPPDAAPPADATPPPTDLSPTSKPTAAQWVPDLDSMKVAATSGKLGVAADVRYSFDSTAAAGQPVTLNIAVVPRVAGQTLAFSLERAEGVQVAAGPVTLLKVGQADTLRQQYSITRTAGDARVLRVLVTHHWNGGSAFGFYSIPFD